jgi:hypothetical protein
MDKADAASLGWCKNPIGLGADELDLVERLDYQSTGAQHRRRIVGVRRRRWCVSRSGPSKVAGPVGIYGIRPGECDRLARLQSGYRTSGIDGPHALQVTASVTDDFADNAIGVPGTTELP